MGLNRGINFFQNNFWKRWGEKKFKYRKFSSEDSLGQILSEST